MTSPDHDSERDLGERLRALRADPPDDGFRAALHRRLAEAPPPAPPDAWARLREALDALRRPLPAASLAGAAAVALLALVLARGPGPADPPGPRAAEPARAVAAATLPSTKVAIVRLDLAVDVAVANADIQVSLPEGLAFWSEGQALAERTFAWSQPLSAGRNEIPIALRGLRPGRYHVTVTARAGDQLIAHDVPLEVTEG
jgi:hypothetical protein